MAWFRHERSGQVFEAVGVWEKLARADRHAFEVPPPTLITREEAVQPSPEAPAGSTGESESASVKEVESSQHQTSPSSPRPSRGRSSGQARRTKP